MRASRPSCSFVLAAMLLACVVLGTAHAQLLEVTAAVVSGTSERPGSASSGSVQAATVFSVAIRQVRVGSTTVGVALGHSAGIAGLAGAPTPGTSGTGAAQLDVTLSANETFGPLGNVIFELAGSLRTDALAQVEVTVRGTIGPLAARLRLSAFSADPIVFAPVSMAADGRPSLGHAGVGGALGITARFGRNVILDAGPEFYVTGAGLASRFNARLRRLRTFGDNELRLYLDGSWVSGSGGGPGGLADWHTAFGAGVLWPRGRAPDLEVAVLIGTRGATVAPGLRVSLAESLPGGIRLAFDGSLEPYRVDVHPLRVTAAVELPLAGSVTLGFTAVTAALDQVRQTTFALQSSFKIPVDLP